MHPIAPAWCPATAAGRLVLAAALVAATAPVWRWFVAGAEPSIDELLQLRCSAAAAAKPAAAKAEAAEPAPAKPALAEPMAAKPTAAKPMAAKPMAAKPMAAKPTVILQARWGAARAAPRAARPSGPAAL